MRFKKLMAVAFIASIFNVGIANADIRVILPHTAGADACDTLPGSWTGQGNVLAFDITPCAYTGSGSITKESAPNQFHIDLDLEAAPNQSPLCVSANVPLEATCSAGVVTITTTGIDLSGQATDNQITFNGGSIEGIYIVKSIDLSKVG